MIHIRYCELYKKMFSNLNYRTGTYNASKAKLQRKASLVQRPDVRKIVRRFNQYLNK